MSSNDAFETPFSNLKINTELYYPEKNLNESTFNKLL